MAKIFATEAVAIVGNQTKYRLVQIDEATGERLDLCVHLHDSRDEAEDCVDACQARGLLSLSP